MSEVSFRRHARLALTGDKDSEVYAIRLLIRRGLLPRTRVELGVYCGDESCHEALGLEDYCLSGSEEGSCPARHLGAVACSVCPCWEWDPESMSSVQAGDWLRGLSSRWLPEDLIAAGWAAANELRQTKPKSFSYRRTNNLLDTIRSFLDEPCGTTLEAWRTEEQRAPVVRWAPRLRASTGASPWGSDWRFMNRESILVCAQELGYLMVLAAIRQALIARVRKEIMQCLK